jgi:hypothetical protein
MNTPGFTAEASLNKRARHYISLRGMPLIDDGLSAGPVSFAQLGLRPPLPNLLGPHTPEEVCNGCVDSCVYLGLGGYLYCRYVLCQRDCFFD